VEYGTKKLNCNANLLEQKFGCKPKFPKLAKMAETVNFLRMGRKVKGKGDSQTGCWTATKQKENENSPCLHMPAAGIKM
jgi:hypothetical protein